MASPHRLIIRERERTVITLIQAHMRAPPAHRCESVELGELVSTLMAEIEEADIVASVRAEWLARARVGSRLRAYARKFRASLARSVFAPVRVRAPCCA